MVVGWFTRLVVVAAILGILGFDTINLTTAHTGAREDADNAATDAAAAWSAADGSQYPSQAMLAAVRAADARLVAGESLVPGSISVSSDGTLTLTVRRTAEHTLVAHDIGALRHLVTFDVTGSGTPPTS